jgi:hypothetical protein
MQRRGQTPLIRDDDLESFWIEERLPRPQQQANDLVLWAGDNQLSPDAPIRVALPFLGAWVGTSLVNVTEPHAGIKWLLTHLADEKLLSSGSSETTGVMMLHLTMQGWDKYAELRSRRTESRTAFMAMKFGDPELEAVVADCFKPAVRRTGFELRLLRDQQKAGSIDNQMRAALISSRFVIADLSHGNQGAYWEAGFAEGLDRPVFYTCKASVWENEKTHFDTNHMLHILWDGSKLKQVENELASTIRSTLRGEAQQSDE